ncbi:YdcF family protein [Nocardia takedensis]|uniref:YdcF family protein n=1 Tax=Nocardia takedensis TaxID=259390 RepID=UPI000318006F|nr:YdcF family protein [Nocardia takedensis]
MILLAIGLGLLGVFAMRFHSDRRRLGNGVFLLLGVLCTGVWVVALGDQDVLPLLALVLVVLAPLLMFAFAMLLIVNGAQLIRREGVRVHTLLPFVVAAAFLSPYVGFVIAFVTGNFWTAIATASATLLVSYLGMLLLAFLTYAFLYSRLGYESGMDAIVVHGSGLDGGDVPPLLAGRLDRALTVYRDEIASGASPLVVTSGGKGDDEEVAEADAMARYLRERGLPEEAILHEDRSTNTHENLLFTKRLLVERGGAGRMVLVTSNFHVLRTAILARTLGLDAEVIGSHTAMYYLPAAILREFAGVVVQYRWTNISACLVLAALPPLAALAVRDLPLIAY